MTLDDCEIPEVREQLERGCVRAAMAPCPALNELWRRHQIALDSLLAATHRIRELETKIYTVPKDHWSTPRVAP